MKRTLLLVPLVMFAALGAGCSFTSDDVPGNVNTTTTIPTPVVTTTVPTTTSTTPTATSTNVGGGSATSTLVDGRQEEWRESLFSEFVFFYPGTSTHIDPESPEAKKDGLVTQIELPTAVENPGTRDVPKTILRVYRRALMTRCDASATGRAGVTEVHSIGNAYGVMFCAWSSSEGAAGNLYNTHEYRVNMGNGSYVFTFVTHSVQCANYPDPAAQCVAYSEERDTEIFNKILGTVIKR
ncbi:hypothetical protein KBB27_00280 [Patescibacteria group bacterium]|nr:hypothetical protein [Patescibacteria group bacterium]